VVETVDVDVDVDVDDDVDVDVVVVIANPQCTSLTFVRIHVPD